MNKIFPHIKTIALITIFSLGLISCSEEENGSPNHYSITEITERNNSFSILLDALERTGLDETFNNPGNYTIFAPTNAAFDNFFASIGISGLNDIPTPTLTEILMNHIFQESIFTSDLPSGYTHTSATNPLTGNAMSLYINKTSGVRLNGVANIMQSNIVATNGLMHVVDGVLGLPTVMTFTKADPRFSTMTSTFVREEVFNFNEVLNDSEIEATFFIPTNEAFESLLAEQNIESLDDIETETIENIIKYHIVSGTALPFESLTNGQSISTFLGTNFTLNVSGGNVSATDVNSRTATVSNDNIEAVNGYIHVLNKVLLP